MKRKQCKKCPWKVGVDPHEIPDGYSEELHAGLSSTIATGADLAALSSDYGLKIMACHESKPGQEQPCCGWLHNQLGVGNNLGLRLAAMSGQVDADVELDGEQHEAFEDTLPERCSHSGSEACTECQGWRFEE